MANQAAQIESPAVELERMTSDITKLESIVDTWDESQQLTVLALKSSIEELHKEALRRLIRALKDDPAAGARLREALADPVIYGVLLYHGLIREPLQSRVEAALSEVRPMLKGHGGDVELVAVKPPDTVEIRLVGSCHGCPASGQTLTEGIEKAIRAKCPEIVNINQVSRGRSAPTAEQLHFISPFASSESQGWLAACQFDEVPEGGILERQIKERSVLIHRSRGEISCVDNTCAHLGMPLEMGEIQDGVITCSYHGFRYLLSTGECLTVPEVQLKVHAVRVIGSRIEVRLEE